jgi:hypothetical protein
MSEFAITVEKRGSDRVVLCGGRIITRVVPDEKYSGMYRILADGKLSDMVNISRATDAAQVLALSILNRNTASAKIS